MAMNIYQLQAQYPPCPNKGLFSASERRVNWKPQFGFKFAFIAICTLCFLYQTLQLVSLYLSGKTVVENRVERNKYNRLPAVTICMPTFMDMEKFAEYFLKNSTKTGDIRAYNDFNELKNNVTNGWTREAESKQGQLFDNFLWDRWSPHISNISLREIFDNISIDVKHLKLEEADDNKALNEQDQLVKLPDPIIDYSIVPWLDPRLCITVFSDLDEYYKQNKLRLFRQELVFEVNKLAWQNVSKIHPVDFYAALHSPNDLPEFKQENIFQKIQISQINYITYSESQIRLLPSPYETNCTEYSGNSSRNDCIQDCVDKKLGPAFNLSCIWTYDNFRLIRKHSSLNYQERNLCDWIIETKEFTEFERIERIIEEQNRWNAICEDQCPKNCLESYYTYDIETRMGLNYRYEGNNFSIKIDHSRFPDQIIEHKPILDWITLVSNLGGLLGMWLGFSFALTFNMFVDMLFERYYKRQRLAHFSKAFHLNPIKTKPIYRGNKLKV